MKSILDYQKKVETAYDNFANKYDDELGSIMTMFATQLLRDIQIPKNPKVLDVGCGTGIATFELMKRVNGKGEFYGIDISQKMVDFCRKRALESNQTNVEFRKGNAEKLFFPKSSFNLVISNQAFHWIANKEVALNEMFRVLKPKGKVALVFQGGLSFEDLFRAYDRVRERHPEYALFETPRSPTLEETRKLFNNVGFKENKIYQIEKAIRIPPSFLWSNKDLTTSPWKIGFSLEDAKEVQKEIREELQSIKQNNWDKTVVYYIFGIGTKKS